MAATLAVIAAVTFGKASLARPALARPALLLAKARRLRGLGFIHFSFHDGRLSKRKLTEHEMAAAKAGRVKDEMGKDSCICRTA